MGSLCPNEDNEVSQSITSKFESTIVATHQNPEQTPLTSAKRLRPASQFRHMEFGKNGECSTYREPAETHELKRHDALGWVRNFKRSSTGSTKNIEMLMTVRLRPISLSWGRRIQSISESVSPRRTARSSRRVTRKRNSRSSRCANRSHSKWHWNSMAPKRL